MSSVFLTEEGSFFSLEGTHPVYQRGWLYEMILMTDPFQDIGIGCCGVCPPDASTQLENGEFPFADND